MTPGAMVLARISWSAHSTATDCIRLWTPAFPAPEWAWYGAPRSEFVAPIEMMAPPPRSIICSAAANVQFAVPSRMVPTTERQPFAESSSAGQRKFAPALFTSTERSPSSSRTVSTISSTRSGSRTSTVVAHASTPRCSISAATGSRCSIDRLAIATFAPWSANPSAIARPIPVPPPVTSTVSPSSRSSANISVLGGVSTVIVSPPLDPLCECSATHRSRWLTLP